MILLTGGGGFTGRFVAEELLRRRIPFKCLVRDPDRAPHLREHQVPVAIGDVQNRESVRSALGGCTGVINLVSFQEDHVASLLRDAREQGIRRSLFVGTTAMFTRLDAASKAIRVKAEAEIAELGLDWTVLRPTMIYGARGDRNMERLIRAVHRFRIHPLIGNGDKLLQPIHVTDLAKAIVDAFHCPAAERRAFNLSGRAPISYRGIVEEVATGLGKRVHLIRLPLFLAIAGARIAGRIPGLPRLKTEQVLRLNEDKSFDHHEARRTWGFDPLDFATGIRLELRDLGLPARR